MSTKSKQIAKPKAPTPMHVPAVPNTPAGTGIINIVALQMLSDWLQRNPMEEVEVESAGVRIRLKKPSANVAQTTDSLTPAAPPSSAPAHTPTRLQSNTEFKSPMVGTFYRSAGPDAAPFVKEGDTVKVGQTLCIIEAMKTMNQIAADRAGTVVKILAANASPVEFGQPLMVIE